MVFTVCNICLAYVIPMLMCELQHASRSDVVVGEATPISSGGFRGLGFLFTINCSCLPFQGHLNSSMNQTFSLEVGGGGYLESFPPPPTTKKNNNQAPVSKLIRVAFPKKNQGQKNCFHFFSRRNYHGPWNSNRLCEVHTG